MTQKSNNVTKITLEANIPENEFVEALLNMTSSKVERDYLMFSLGIYALAHSWNFDKFVYYLGLINEVKHG